MLVKVARFSIIFITVFTCAIFLPDFYWKAFDQRINRPFIQYSPVLEDFLIFKVSQDEPRFSDRKGNEYSRSEADSLSPLFNARQLIYEGRFPDSLRGRKITPEEVRLNSIYLRISPEDIRQDQIPLYPLFESQSGRVNLEMPESFFRIADRMEFINTLTNQLEEATSEKFTAALNQAGFNFPARLIAGNPTTRKPFDEGYFIIDSENRWFHLKMVKGEPFVRSLEITQDLKVKYVLVQEMNLREFYALLVSEDSRFFMVSYDNYRLVEIPVDSYNWQQTEIRLMGDIFYRNVICYNDTGVVCLVSDRNYQPLDRYQESWEDRYQRQAGIISEYLFPYTLELLSGKSRYVGFYLKPPVMRSAGGILLFLVLTFLFLRYRKYSIRQNWLEFVVILLSGIFGFIAILLFPPVRDKF